LLTVGRTYNRHESFSSPGQKLLRDATSYLSHLAPDLKVVSGGGKGYPTYTPWLAFLNTQATSSPQNGVYLVYIFSADLSSVTLTLNQGVTDVAEAIGWQLACARLAQDASRLRGLFSSDEVAGLSTDLDLGVDAKRQEAYQAG